MHLARFTAKLIPTALGIGLAIIFAWTQFTDAPFLRALEQRVESIAYDLRLNASLKKDDTDNRIIIIDIDEKSIGAEGRWPWPRDKMARLTDRLFEAGVIVAGYDIFFTEPERNKAAAVLKQAEQDHPGDQQLINTLNAMVPKFDNDRRLAESLMDRDITLGYLFHAENTKPIGHLPQPLLSLSSEMARQSGIKEMPNYTASLPLLQKNALSSGFVTTWPDPDGIIRRTPMIIRHGENVYGSLSLNVAKLYLFLENVTVNTAKIGQLDAVENIDLGGTIIPTDAYGFALVPYRGPAGNFPYISATDVLNGHIDEEILEGAIVLIGASAVGIADLVATPVENIYPGVEVHANMIRAILDKKFYSEPAWADGANLIITLAIGVLLALILPHLGPMWLILISATTGIGLAFGNFWLWQEKGLALSLAWLLIMIAALAALNITLGFLSETRKRSQLKSMFGQYVPPQLVDTMTGDASSYGFEGDSRVMTVLFADIRGFTTLSEKLSPSELRTLLNRYFTHMTEIIFDNQGTIDKYVGDMIMAFWGAPLKNEDHAKHAIEAAMAMLKKTEELKPELKAAGYPEVNIGIGLNTGLMNVGDMGSSYRRAYTVLGDNVNLGSRIEGLTKFYGAGLVIGETTREGQDDFIFRRLDLVKVKGKTEAVKVFEPLCKKDKATPELLTELRHHEQGLDAYLKQEWDKAEQIFAGLNKQQPDARIYSLYMERINELRHRTLGKEWDGVYERREK